MATKVLEKVKSIHIKCNDNECGQESVVTAIANYDLKKIEEYVKCKTCGGSIKITKVGKEYDVEA